MNNYSVIEKFLHRSVLSSQYMREVLFDVEQAMFLKKEYNFDDDHVFIAGLARSGSTILLNTIYQSNQFASLTYEDMPFILAPNLWEKISPKKNHSRSQERVHGDGIKISTNSPEAFEEIFWKTFNHNSKNRHELFIKFISLILKKNHKSRYLSKNNQNIRRLDLVSDIFPDSKILIPFRDPMQQAMSLFTQHRRFIKKQNNDTFVRNYMKWIGHSEFGVDYQMIYANDLFYPDHMDCNHWLEQWYLTYNSIFELTAKHKNLHIICYESLCNNPKVWINIKDLLSIKQSTGSKFLETKKVINEDFDENLSEKCYGLYRSISSKAFGE